MAKHKRLKPIGDYLYDKGEMIEQMFSSIPIVEIRNMVPIKLQGMPLHELKAECLVELLGISDREILSIVDGKKDRNVSSSDSEQGGTFVISDEERKISGKRIKKEKKDTVRKIKTERVSSKKDGTSRSSEPSTSKKKRKSKEIVEDNYQKKKKKSEDKPANIPSSSRDVAKVPVSKKKKDKGGEKKKGSSKKDDGGDIVVLDDDSDKEEKSGQKSLLDLLELEMRARAIRSLLKKEEAVQAQKILSEYKDEPDDLIPIDIEPPHIELLSDSEGEETTNTIDLEAQENTSTGRANDGVSGKQPEDSLQSSRSPPRVPSDGCSSSSCAIEGISTSEGRSEILVEDSSKSANKIECQASKNDLPDPSPLVMKDCEKGDEVSIIGDHDDTVQPSVSGDTIAFKAPESHDNSSRASIGKAVGNDNKEQDASKIDSSRRPEESQPISSSTEDSRNEMDTGHFLVIEEPSVVQVTDGSQIKAPNVETSNSFIELMKPSSHLDSDKNQNACSVENVGSLNDRGGQATLAESPQIYLNSDVANEKNAVENPGANFIMPLPKEGSKCDIQVEGYSGSSCTSAAILALQEATVSRESTDRCIVDDDSHSQFEDEVLDYDYNPVNSCCERESKAPVSLSESAPSCVADFETKSLGNDSGDSSDDRKNEEKPNEVEDSAHRVSSECGVVEPDTNCCTELPGSSDENLVRPFDLTSVSVHLPPEETASKKCSLAQHLDDCTVDNDSVQTSSSKDDTVSRIVLEAVEVEEARGEDGFNLLKGPEPVALVSLCLIDTEDNNSIQGSDGSNEANNDLSSEEADPENLQGCKDTETICSNTQPSSGGKGMEEQAVSPKQNQVILEKDLTVQLSGFVSGSSENKETINTVTNDCLVLEGNVSNVGKIENPHSSSVCVTVSDHTTDLNHPVVQQTPPVMNSERDERTMLSEPCLSLRSDGDSDLVISNVMCKRTRMVPVDCNEINTCDASLSPNTNDEIVEEGQHPECTSVIASGIVKSSNSTPSQMLEPLVLSEDLLILDETYGVRVSNAGTPISTLQSDVAQHPSSEGAVNDVVEIIDITEREHVDSSEVVFISEERADSESVDESDNEISDKAALILEQMNDILNDGECRVGESGSSGQPSPRPTSVGPEEVCTVDSGTGSSEPATDEENETDILLDDTGYTSVLEVSDLDDTSEGEETSDTNGRGSSLDRGSIEIIDDSESVCSVESQRDGSQSDDCVMVLQPQGSTSDDCIIVTESEMSKNSNCVIIGPEGSESDDCAIVSQHTDTVPDERVPNAKATGSVFAENPSTPADKDGVIVTIIIEDDEGEEAEVKLLTEDVPAEILELDDDDEAKTNWTARWLESDNVKKVVQTSKILTNVRKQMKMKLKKIEVPVANNIKLPEEKSAPPLIGSVEEYHRLVKEGVIFSKATQNDEKTESSKNPIEGSVDPVKDSTDSVSAGSSVKEGQEKKSDERETVEKKRSDKSGRKKKLEKSERKRKSDEREKKKSDKSEIKKKSESDKSILNTVVPELPPSPGTKGTFTCSQSNVKFDAMATGKVAKEDAVREDGEIIESPNLDCIGNPKEANKTNRKDTGNAFIDRVCHSEWNNEKDVDRAEREEGETTEKEEGETSEKEEGEISDSDDDTTESQKSSQPDLRSSHKTASGPKGCCGSASPLSSIPLPHKPPTKQSAPQQQANRPKQQSTKTPDRNSAAKRFILRNLQLGRKKTAKSKNKKKKKKGAGGGNKKGLGYVSNAAKSKNKPASFPQTNVTYEKSIHQTEVVNSLTSASNSLQTVAGIQPSNLATYSGLAQPISSSGQLGPAQNTSANVSNTSQMYDSYYSWAYSQGLISSANGNYGYGTPESTPDPNVYKQWEEYYRKLMEACKVSAEHASAGALYNFASPSAGEKSGYTWVFDHSAGASQNAQVQASADSTTEPVAQVQAPPVSSETSGVSVAPVTSEMSDKDRFESWQYRYGLKGLLKEHFIPPPTAPSTGDGSQKP